MSAADDRAPSERYRLPRLRIAVSGSSGLVGKPLCDLLRSAGHDVLTIVRAPESSDVRTIPAWAPAPAWQANRYADRLDGIDAVIHLAGKPIAERRWNESIRREIRQSRVEKTGILCDRLAALPRPPKVLLCASAIGFYGDRGDEVLTESSPPADTFLADVVEQWEAACSPARIANVRVANLRFGVILSPRGGALARMLLPAKFGGGRTGPGTQWWSWIAIDDVLAAIYHTLATESLDGPVNFTAPGAVRNSEFVEVLGRVLNRPALFPAPASALRLMLGEMTDHLLLASARVVPEKLVASGYQFRFPELEPALRHLLDR